MKSASIRTKFFLLLAALNVTLTLAVYLINVWNFERGLDRYLSDQARARAELVAARLAADDARQAWAIADLAQLRRMAFAAINEAEGLSFPPPPDGELNLPFGLALLDADFQALLGRPHPEGSMLPVTQQGAPLGYLQIPPSHALPRSVAEAFAEQQRHSFALIAAGMLLASVLAAWLLSRWLGRAIAALARGTRALIAGDCEVRLPVSSNDELGQLAEDFNLLAQTLSANRRSRQEWIVNIAHELRTPLTVMLGEIEAVEDGVHAPNRRWQARLGQKIRQLSLLVNDLHQLAESDLGALRCQTTLADLSSVVRDWLESHRPAIERAGLTLELPAATRTPVSIDLARFRQLLGNLLQNSLRYTDAPGTLRVAIDRRDEGAQLVWEDSAPGVDSADLARLTERLYRVEASRSRAKGGAGLGLSIAQAIVDAHGGTLAVAHSPLGGVRLTLKLPGVRP